MQYPAGTYFTVNKTKLLATSFRGKLLFKDGLYSILDIKKKNNTVEYALNYNSAEKVTLVFGSCRDMDRIVAYCRNEVYFEPNYGSSEDI